MTLSKREAIKELGLTLWAWMRGEGRLVDLLLSWMELAAGVYPVSEKA